MSEGCSICSDTDSPTRTCTDCGCEFCKLCEGDECYDCGAETCEDCRMDPCEECGNEVCGGCVTEDGLCSECERIPL